MKTVADEALGELQQHAKAFGLDAVLNEVGDGYFSFDLSRGGERAGKLWYLEAVDVWTNVEPCGAENLDDLLSAVCPAEG